MHPPLAAVPHLVNTVETLENGIPVPGRYASTQSHGHDVKFDSSMTKAWGLLRNSAYPPVAEGGHGTTRSDGRCGCKGNPAQCTMIEQNTA